MRPAPAAGVSITRNSAADSLASSNHASPLTCFIATEGTIDATDDIGIQYQHYLSKPDPEIHNPRNSRHRQQMSTSGSTSVSWPSPSLSTRRGLEIPNEMSRPITPVLASTSRPESIISSSSSPVSSSALSVSTSRISSSLSLVHAPQYGIGYDLSPTIISTDDHTPQLIMPSPAVPARRPFSEIGKVLGKLKVLVAGEPGIGKTSLIASITQSCEHIVHVDHDIQSKEGGYAEIFASTRPYPWWRAEPDLAAPSRVRPLTTNEILDRNICFVDCSSRQKSDVANTAMHYIESRLLPLAHRPIADTDLWRLLSSGAEPIVDAVLYLLPHYGPEPADVEMIRALDKITNVIPLLARVDELDEAKTTTSKQEIYDHLRRNNVTCFSFCGPDSDQNVSNIFGVSSHQISDPDTIDASILMSSEYVQPLASTDLNMLVEQMISPDGMARLRHSAALKCVRWRRQEGFSSTIKSTIGYRPPNGRSDLLPLLNDNILLQQHQWRPIAMASWADNLRQSLIAERIYESPVQYLATNTKVGDMPLTRLVKPIRNRRHRHQRSQEVSQHQDPLGLLVLAGQIKLHSKFSLELVSSVGVLGYFTSWLIRPDGRANMLK